MSLVPSFDQYCEFGATASFLGRTTKADTNKEERVHGKHGRHEKNTVLPSVFFRAFRGQIIRGQEKRNLCVRVGHVRPVRPASNDAVHVTHCPPYGLSKLLPNLPPPPHQIDGRDHEQGQQGGGNHAAHHGGGDTAHDLGAGAVAEHDGE